MTIRLDSPKVISLLLVVGGSVLLSILAASQNNTFWSSPLLGLALMLILGKFPPVGKRGWFLWTYVLLILGSAGLLLFTPEKVYWTSPLLLGVLANILVDLPEIKFVTGHREKRKNDEIETDEDVN